MEDHTALFRRAGPLGLLPEVQPRDPAQIQYTSGTTGFPKGVVLHHHGLTNNTCHGAARTGLEPGGTIVLYMPLFHTGGCAHCVLGSVQNNRRIVIVRQFDPQIANALIESECAQAFGGVPTIPVAMLAADRIIPRDFNSVRVIGSGAALASPELIRQAYDRLACGFFNQYGQTETSPLLTISRTTDPFEDLCQSVGQPMPHTEVSIRDPQANAVVPLDTIGEICALGYSLMLGYNYDAKGTAKTIDAEGWLHTGDLGTIDARGFAKITGRVKEMIIRGGENLLPAEIENVLLEYAEGAVVGVPDARFGEAVAAFVRPSAGAQFDPAALIAHCRDQIAAQKAPVHWIEVDE